MTAQEAARVLLEMEQRPLPTREIARRALERGLVHSRARNPVESVAQTIEKNIRQRLYNRPPLVFFQHHPVRLLALPEWAEHTALPWSLDARGEAWVRIRPENAGPLRGIVASGRAADLSEAANKILAVVLSA